MSKSFADRLISATNYLYEGHDSLGWFLQETVSLKFLDGVAMVRYGLFVVAELLNKSESEWDNFGYPLKTIANQLLALAEKLCTDPHINYIDITGGSDTNSPCVYLLKLLIRQYGTDCLQRVSKDYRYQWVVPPELRQGEEVRRMYILVTHYY